MSIMNNFHVLFDTYLPMMNDIVLANMRQHVRFVIPLTHITIFQVLGLALLYNPEQEFFEQDKRGVT